MGMPVRKLHFQRHQKVVIKSGEYKNCYASVYSHSGNTVLVHLFSQPGTLPLVLPAHLVEAM